MKATKKSVDYGPGHRNGDHCAVCEHFQPKQRTCEVVQGRILPGDWCKKFKPKE